MSNYHTHHHESSVSSNGSTFASRRDIKASNTTGELPSLNSLGFERARVGGSDFEEMIASLRDLFESDRQVASQPDATRCGICYLHHHVAELEYREEGFYVCVGCAKSLGHQRLSILRKQQKM